LLRNFVVGGIGQHPQHPQYSKQTMPCYITHTANSNYPSIGEKLYRRVYGGVDLVSSMTNLLYLCRLGQIY
jgi:hypothetical protein